MSDTPELPEDEALAAEHAMGLLEAADLIAAEARLAGDADYAAKVESWRMRLAPLGEEAEAVAPPEAVWRRVQSQLPANDDQIMGKLRFWRRTAVGSIGLAAASVAAALVLVANTPSAPVGAPPSLPLLNARLAGDNSVPLFIASYDPDRRALIVTSLVPPGSDPAHAHELWLLAPGGSPRSLGIIEPGAARALPMQPELARLVASGVQLAVSVEPPGGSPSKTAPSGPIAASGEMKPI